MDTYDTSNRAAQGADDAELSEQDLATVAGGQILPVPMPGTGGDPIPHMPPLPPSPKDPPEKPPGGAGGTLPYIVDPSTT